MLHLIKKKRKRKTPAHIIIEISMIWSTAPEIQQNKRKLVILVHFFPFIPLKTPKLNILKNEKICWSYHFTHVHQKSQWYDVRFLRYAVRQTKILSFWAIFCSLTTPLNDLKYQNIEKSEKNAWRYYPFIHKYVP